MYILYILRQMKVGTSNSLSRCLWVCARAYIPINLSLVSAPDCSITFSDPPTSSLCHVTYLCQPPPSCLRTVWPSSQTLWPPALDVPSLNFWWLESATLSSFSVTRCHPSTPATTPVLSNDVSHVTCRLLSAAVNVSLRATLITPTDGLTCLSARGLLCGGPPRKSLERLITTTLPHVLFAHGGQRSTWRISP